MERISKKKILMLIFIICIINIFALPSKVQADTEGDKFLSNVSNGISAFKERGENQLNSMGIDTETLLSPLLGIIGFAYWCGCVAVIGGTIWKAVKYSNANPAQKSQTKQGLINWIIASCLVVGAYPIWKVLVLAFAE